MIGERYRKDGVTRTIVDTFIDMDVRWAVLDDRQHVYVYDELTSLGWALVSSP